eukprot:TRINITY_DN15930_c0_g2_i1.p2 TRINITY_DN15930_c0_g2~~TRINITY_DN15930_c0_g2_i1.p2  ORF type:complete len:211 (+),score=30.01 TRINITY_DN15930_c0_g2_i1:30-635(+)
MAVLENCGAVNFFTGDTTGLIAVWEIHCNQLNSDTTSCSSYNCNDNNQNSLIIDNTFKPKAIYEFHSAGVNCMSVGRSTNGDKAVLVSGGDDQALSVIVFDVFQNQLQMLGNQIIKNAHSSAIKGVWVKQNFVFSIGLDQKLGIWEVSFSEKSDSFDVELLSMVSLEVLEPMGLDGTYFQESNLFFISVAGRGVQLLKISF